MDDHRRFQRAAGLAPAVERSVLSDNGQQRTLHLAGGARIVERLENHDDAGRRYSYRITQSPLPLNDYRSVLSVRDDGPDGCTVEWLGSFTAPEASLAEMKTVVAGIYEAGFENLRRMFGG
jgi:hypothetical protein